MPLPAVRCACISNIASETGTLAIAPKSTIIGVAVKPVSPVIIAIVRAFVTSNNLIDHTPPVFEDDTIFFTEDIDPTVPEPG